MLQVYWLCNCSIVIAPYSLKNKMGFCSIFYLKAKKQLQETASDFERASEKYNSAKGKVADLEKLMSSEDRVFDSALQELLNHATVEVSVTVCCTSGSLRLTITCKI